MHLKVTGSIPVRRIIFVFPHSAFHPLHPLSIKFRTAGATQHLEPWLPIVTVSPAEISASLVATTHFPVSPRIFVRSSLIDLKFVVHQTRGIEDVNKRNETMHWER